MTGHEYRDLIAGYIHRVYGAFGLAVYTEISLGKTIIGKDRKIDVFIVRSNDQHALAIECKFQEGQGTTDEKIPYALLDLEALWVPGCLVYAGDGWSAGVLHTLEGHRLASYCLPERGTLGRTLETRELDHVLGAVFGLWDHVIPESRMFSKHPQLSLALKGPKKAVTRAPGIAKKVADEKS